MYEAFTTRHDLQVSLRKIYCFFTEIWSRFRYYVHKSERIPGSKYKLRIGKSRTYQIPGRTYALNKKNDNMCSEIFNWHYIQIWWQCGRLFNFPCEQVEQWTNIVSDKTYKVKGQIFYVYYKIFNKLMYTFIILHFCKITCLANIVCLRRLFKSKQLPLVFFFFFANDFSYKISSFAFIIIIVLPPKYSGTYKVCYNIPSWC